MAVALREAQDVILHVLLKIGHSVNVTKLVKLVYLIDYVYYQNYGHTLTGLQYMWDSYGPNTLGNGISIEAEKLAKKGHLGFKSYRNRHRGITRLFGPLPDTQLPKISPEAEAVIDDVLRQYGHLDTRGLIAISKKTEPFTTAQKYGLLNMKRITSAEKTSRREWQAYQNDVKREGFQTLEVLKKKYGLK